MTHVNFRCISMQSDDDDFLRKAALLIDDTHCARYLSKLEINAFEGRIELSMSEECLMMEPRTRDDVWTQILNWFEREFAAWNVTTI